MQHLRLLPRTDRYFALTFLRLFVLVLLALLSVLVVADLFQQYDEFVKYAEESEADRIFIYAMLLQYYATFAPAMLIQYLLPMVFMLAAVITVTSSCVHNEYTVLRSSGVSMPRGMAPILLMALLLGYGVQLLRETTLPFLLRRAHAVSTTIKPKGAKPIALVLRHDGVIRHISMGHFDFYENRYVARNLRIETRDENAFYGGQADFVAYTAWEAYLQPRTDPDREAGDDRDLQWKPSRKGLIWDYTHAGYTKTGWSDPVPTFITPGMLERQVLGEAVMTRGDLSRLSGEDLEVRVEMIKRSSEPWALAALLLLGLSLVLRLSTSGRDASYIINVVIAVGLCAGYYVLRNVGIGLGQSEALNPLLAGWLPVLLMGGVGAWLASRLA